MRARNPQPGTVIRGNVFEEIAGAAIHQFHQGDPPEGSGCEFSGNTFRKPRPMTVRSGQKPYYMDIIAWGQGGNRIFNNIFYGEGKRSGASLNSVSNQVCNNIFISSATAVEFYVHKPGNQVVNNIMLDATRSFLIWPADSLPQTLDYNLYYNASTPPRWQRDGKVFQNFRESGQTATETHSHYEDPRLVSATDAHLRPGSPAIDAGVPLLEVHADFDGVTRPQGDGPDIGAYESIAGRR